MQENMWKSVMRQMGVGIIHILSHAQQNQKEIPWWNLRARWQMQGLIAGVTSVGHMFKQTWTALDMQENIDEAKNGDGK